MDKLEPPLPLDSGQLLVLGTRALEFLGKPPPPPPPTLPPLLAPLLSPQLRPPSPPDRHVSTITASVPGQESSSFEEVNRFVARSWVHGDDKATPGDFRSDTLTTSQAFTFYSWGLRQRLTAKGPMTEAWTLPHFLSQVCSRRRKTRLNALQAIRIIFEEASFTWSTEPGPTIGKNKNHKSREKLKTRDEMNEVSKYVCHLCIQIRMGQRNYLPSQKVSVWVKYRTQMESEVPRERSKPLLGRQRMSSPDQEGLGAWKPRGEMCGFQLVWSV